MCNLTTPHVTHHIDIINDTLMSSVDEIQVNSIIEDMSQIILQASQQCSRNTRTHTHSRDTRDHTPYNIWHDIECKTLQSQFNTAKHSLNKHVNKTTLKSVNSTRNIHTSTCKRME